MQTPRGRSGRQMSSNGRLFEEVVVNITRYRVRLTLTEMLLGTAPKDKELYATYMASVAEDPDGELETAPETVEEKGWTGFHTLEDGTPILLAYMIKGFFKDACGMLRRDAKSLSARVRAYKRVIDGMVFVEPRRIPLRLPAGAEMGVLERPLRAQTAQGERVALARSDTVPAGTVLEFEVTVIGNVVSEKLLREWLEYGRFRGLGQWRNAGYGAFTHELEVLP